MCYSPEVDLVAGLVVGAVGIDALHHVDDRRDLSLAAIPLLLATHQLIEAVVWWGLEDQVPRPAGILAVSAYLIIALGVVPIVVPYAVMRSERVRRRQAEMWPFVVLGVAVSIILLFGIFTNAYGAAIGGSCIAYETVTPGGGVTVGLYGLAVCVPFLMSSQRRLVTFGIVNVPALILLSVLFSNGLISLWCVWAAVTSVVIARHIRKTPTTQSVGAQPGTTSAPRTCRAIAQSGPVSARFVSS